MHKTEHPFAGKRMQIKPGTQHLQDPGFGGSIFTVEDWWDRVGGDSFKNMLHNPACFIYDMRRRDAGIEPDDEVVYGKTGNGLGHIVHVSELVDLPDAA